MSACLLTHVWLLTKYFFGTDFCWLPHNFLNMSMGGVTEKQRLINDAVKTLFEEKARSHLRLAKLREIGDKNLIQTCEDTILAIDKELERINGRVEFERAKEFYNKNK